MSASANGGDPSILISGCNPEAGGLFKFSSSGVEMIDRLSTQGVAVAGDRLFRVVSGKNPPVPVSDLLTYDRSGVLRYDRLDGVGDPHDILPWRGKLLVCSSSENAIFSTEPDGRTTVFWQPTTANDAWHVNCLTVVDDQLFATAFGKFEEPRGWAADRRARTGVLLRIPSEEVVLGHLVQPHSPRRLDGAWLLCNSAINELAAVDDRGKTLKRRTFEGFTRGLAVGEDHIYVGESADRHLNDGARRTSRINILDRSSWSLVDAYEVDAAEIYEIVFAPDDLIAGAAIGFRTNATRVDQIDQLGMFASVGVVPHRLWAIGEPLPMHSLKIAFEGEIPKRVGSHGRFLVMCRVTNRGDAIFVSAPPNPIQFCYRWFDLNGIPVDAGKWLHTPLPRALPPGQTVEAAVGVAAPSVPGQYDLAVTLLHEGIAWFDELSPTYGIRGRVIVSGTSATDPRA